MFNKKTLKKEILRIFRRYKKGSFNYKQIAKKLFIKDNLTKNLISQILDEMVLHKKITEKSRGKFRLKEMQMQNKYTYINGIINTKEKNIFVISEEKENIYIDKNDLKFAMDGDEVKVKLDNNNEKTGKIVRVLNAKKINVVGTVEQSLDGNYFFVIPDNKRNFPYDIYISKFERHKTKFKNNDKVLVEIKKRKTEYKKPEGIILKAFGQSGEHKAEINSIMENFNLPCEFEENINKKAEKIVLEITKKEIDRRRDFRKIATFTIDPEDAKDFDDALSIKHLKNGNWEIGIHIADVTHYVKPNTILDKEAYKRGTSVYLVDRVIPMLPERISNFICSLRPNEEKLTFSTVLELDENANIHSIWFGETVINSDKRFTYSQAQEIIDKEEGIFHKELKKLNKFAQILRGIRFKNGSMSFERGETKFILDKNGKAVDMFFKTTKTANQLIEEFMLLANKKVSEFVVLNKKNKKHKSFVFRVHDKPDLEKLNKFSETVKHFGYKFKVSEKDNKASINNLLNEVKGKKEQNIIETLAVRSMSKAEYSTKNIGHYGLFFQDYTHFTSPIRRYSDVLVHRLMKKYLLKKKSEDILKLERKCKHISEMEKMANFAERASIKYKQVEFFKDKIGKIFDGFICEIMNWGMFVELEESKIQGLVSIHSLSDNFEMTDNCTLKGKYSNKKYKLGDNIKVKILKANIQKKQLDFSLLEK
ncbi:MAG: ribonuclease R [Bacteroidetes bacterium 4572_128]|nr:MAG: ribonuclease R [Bacteroidetes bacterium 4572_128]